MLTDTNLPLVLGYCKDLSILETYRVVKDQEEKDSVLKALKTKFFAEHRHELLRACAVAMRVGLLFYCRSLVDPRLKIYSDTLSHSKFVEMLKKIFSLKV